MIVRMQTSLLVIRASQPWPSKGKTAACGAQIDKAIPGPCRFTADGMNGACLILKALDDITGPRNKNALAQVLAS
jgi:hypothetical protein